MSAPAAAAVPAAGSGAAATTTATSNTVVLRDGGIVKKILREGTGDARPPAGADVEVHYTGRLLDGTKFDSSRDRNDTFNFKIGRNQVIKGWDEGVATMRKGELALLTCKPEYAYGAGGSPPKIPPNATLEFEVELFGWTKKVKVTDKKEVMKETEREGEGWNKPNDQAKVTLRWRGKVEGGAQFSAPALWEKPTTFVLGAADQLNQTEGFEEAVKHMLKGEISKFSVEPAFGYGESGNAELKVGPNAALEYDIELIDFEKGKESWEMTGDEKVAYANGKKSAGNAYYALGLKGDTHSLERAAKRYTKALDLFRYDKQFEGTPALAKAVAELKVACNSNLSAVRYKQREWKAAEDACNEVLSADPKHVKCLFRRAQILAQRSEFDGALRDLTAAKAVDPNNADVAKLFTAVQARVKAAKEKERNMWAGAFGKVKLVSQDEDAANAKRLAEAKAKASKGSDDDSGDDEPAPAAPGGAPAAAAAAAPAPAAAAAAAIAAAMPAEVTGVAPPATKA